MKRLAFVFVAVVAVAGCKKAENDRKPAAAKPAPVTTGQVAADGTRSIAIAVSKNGYDPASLRAKPNEKLKLVFTRVDDNECGAQVKVADGKVYDLPINQPVEIAVAAPASGKVDFACGMDMMAGVIVVDN